MILKDTTVVARHDDSGGGKGFKSNTLALFSAQKIHVWPSQSRPLLLVTIALQIYRLYT